MGLLVGLPLRIFSLLFLLLRFLWPLALLWLARWLIRRLRRQAEEPARQKPPKEPDFDGPVYTVDYEDVAEAPLDATADAPEPFGREADWLAVRCDDPERVCAALGGAACPANWASGMEAVRAGTGVFVSPALEGWVLAVGVHPPELSGKAADAWMTALTGQFPQVQFFSTHRAAEYHRWGKFEAGRLVRDYCVKGQRDGVLRDEGDWTAEEIALGFGRFPRQGKAESEAVPCEEDVLDIAAAWGVDPRFADRTYPHGTGWMVLQGSSEKREALLGQAGGQ